MIPVQSVLRFSVVRLSTDDLVSRPGVRITATIGGQVSLDWPAPKARARDHQIELTPSEARALAQELLRAAGGAA
jgi:hypothetical protein